MVVAERFGWTLDQIGKTTFLQFMAACAYIKAYPGRYCVWIDPEGE
jgi:hypothetical protein